MSAGNERMLFDETFAQFSVQNIPLKPFVRSCRYHARGLCAEEQTGIKNGHTGQKPFRSEVPNNDRSVLLICCKL